MSSCGSRLLSWRDVKRFVLLCHQRSGSTVLTRALQQHPAVRMHGELLTNSEDEATRRRVHSVDGRWLTDGGDGAALLEHVFAPRGEAAVGFKLMHYHAASGPAATAWDLLRRDGALGVVHLRRDDLLACLVSDEVAQRRKVWHVDADRPLPDELPPFPVSPERCRALFERVDHWIARTRDWFGDHPLLELEYARDLAADLSGAAARVFAFLGVAPIAVDERLRKIARLGPREQLSNFAELEAAFAGTRWAHLFA
jgi:LPS sulfotransferase NodH